MPQEQETIETLNNLLRRFNDGEKMIKHGSTVPTYYPKTFFEQFFYYESGVTYRLYFYANNTWRYMALT